MKSYVYMVWLMFKQVSGSDGFGFLHVRVAHYNCYEQDYKIIELCLCF